MVAYQSVPARRGGSTAAAIWPVASALPRDPDGSTMVVAIHPKCSCTQASVSELARLLSRRKSLVVHALVYTPADESVDWSRTETRRRLEQIPGVSILPDIDGVEQRRFGLVASGHVLLYGRRGELRFSGGITPSRGHEGDSIGRQMLLRALADDRGENFVSSIFGCTIGGLTVPPQRGPLLGRQQ